ncbi:AfsR/SARP family transcriptional regulator [Ornithinimicrobium sufpigmenti]|uniref:AfsR/SARP family transcriptional regulator n=1 Tax=Ornithinimicrobium sufpigmenti TaxID=2508882 RepID=UPI0015E1952E|nr:MULTISPECIES: BTAD domain-containing putative transcriptional regulator [unclassified Ornithinimicrobium]
MGGFRCENDGAPVMTSATLQRILALLALRGPFLPRAQLAGEMWPEKPESRALANLRSALWRAGAELPGLLVSEPSRVGLSEQVWVDARELESRCLAHVESVPPLGDVLAFAHAATADLLPGWYEDWVLLERERQRQIHLYGMESLTTALLRAGRPADAVIVGLAIVACEPLRESAHRLVIEAHLKMGNVVEAHRQLELCRDHLRRHLGIDPSAVLLSVFGSPTSTDGGAWPRRGVTRS